MKRLGTCFVTLVGGAMIVVCGSSPAWYRVVVEETAAPAGAGSLALVVTVVAGILALVMTVRGRFWLAAGLGLVAVIAAIGADESGPIGWVIVALISACLLPFAWRVLSRMLDDQAAYAVPDYRGEDFVDAIPDGDTVLIYTNIPRSNVLTSVIGSNARRVGTERGMAVYTLKPTRMSADEAAAYINDRGAMLHSGATHADNDYQTIRDTDGGIGGREL